MGISIDLEDEFLKQVVMLCALLVRALGIVLPTNGSSARAFCVLLTEGRLMEDSFDRRQFIAGTAVAGAGLLVASESLAQSRGAAAQPSFSSSPPTGFTPFSAPGRVVKITKSGSLREGNLFPKTDAAQEMVDRGIRELTGRSTVADAWKQVVHPNDIVGIKVNGLGLRNMASNKETVQAIINGVIAAGVPTAQIIVYDQWDGFLGATRITRRDVPAGVRLLTHKNEEVSRETRVPSGRTHYANALLGCTAVIGVPLIKDHSLSGFTGAMKNMTHGSIKNPEDFHRHQCSPQIAELYAHDAIRSRTRLHVMDAFKVLYDGGPRDNPNARVPYESVFLSSDPVALDRLGAEIVDQYRAQNRKRSLSARGTPPNYIDHAATLGLGIADRTRIDLREVTI